MALICRRWGSLLLYAAVELLKERNMTDRLEKVYIKSKEQCGWSKERVVNYVKEVYALLQMKRFL